MGTVEENRLLLEGFWEDLYRLDLPAAASRFAPDGSYTDEGAMPDDVARGPEEIVKRLTLAFGKLSKLRDERRHLVAGENVVITEHVEYWYWPSGEELTLPIVSVHEIHNGQITRWHDYWNLALMLTSAPPEWMAEVAAGWK